MGDGKVSLKMDISRFAPGQPQHDSLGGFELGKGLGQRATLLQGLTQQTARFRFAFGFMNLPKKR